VSLSGGFDELALAELVEMTTIGRKTGRVTVFDAHGEARGELDFCGGRLVGARCGEMSADLAFYALLAVSEGSFSFDSDVVPLETCDLSTEALLIEGMRRLDETRRLRERLPATAIVRLVGGEAEAPLEARVLGYVGTGARKLGDVVEGLLVAGDADEYDALQTLVRLGEREVVRIELAGDQSAPPPESRSPQPELER
jgi:hypothetical protein